MGAMGTDNDQTRSNDEELPNGTSHGEIAWFNSGACMARGGCETVHGLNLTFGRGLGAATPEKEDAGTGSFHPRALFSASRRFTVKGLLINAPDIAQTSWPATFETICLSILVGW